MRLINVDALKEWIENWFVKNAYYHPYSKSNNIPIPELYDILERMPTVKAIPVEWINNWLNTGRNAKYFIPMMEMVEQWEKENGKGNTDS